MKVTFAAIAIVLLCLAAHVRSADDAKKDDKKATTTVTPPKDDWAWRDGWRGDWPRDPRWGWPTEPVVKLIFIPLWFILI